MDDKKRRQLNAERLGKTSPSVRNKFAAVLKDMESHGLKPLIDAAVWRSPAQQAALKRKGYSKVSYSFHNATTKDGRPDSLAVDIVDANVFWDAPKKFWLILAAAAEAHGLDSGIYWGLKNHQRQAIKDIIKARKFDNQNVSLGWDTAHIQIRGLSLLAARLGKRPKVA